MQVVLLPWLFIKGWIFNTNCRRFLNLTNSFWYLNKNSIRKHTSVASVNRKKQPIERGPGFSEDELLYWIHCLKSGDVVATVDHFLTTHPHKYMTPFGWYSPIPEITRAWKASNSGHMVWCHVTLSWMYSWKSGLGARGVVPGYRLCFVSSLTPLHDKNHSDHLVRIRC